MAEVNSTKFYTAEMKKREEEERRALADKATKVFHPPISTLNIIPAQDPAEVSKAAAREWVRHSISKGPSWPVRAWGPAELSQAPARDAARPPADREEFDTYSRIQGYGRLPQESDFKEKSRYASTYRPGTEYFSRLDDMWYDTGYGDIKYDFINRNQDAMNKYMSSRDWNILAGVGMAETQLGEMTDEEIAIFNYLYAQDEAKGDATHAGAYQYIQDLNGELNARQRQDRELMMRDFARKAGPVASTYSLLNAPGRALSYLGQVADYIGDGKIDQNAGYNQFSYNNAAIRGQRAQDISQTVSSAVTGLGDVFGQDWSGAGQTLGGKAGNLYQAGMSMGDSLINNALTGGIAQNAGVTSKVGQKLAEYTGLGIMGAGAAADTVIRKKDMGYDDQRSFTLGTAAGAIEAATEMLGLESLLDKTSMGRSAPGYLTKNVFAEGGEAGISDLFNWGLDEVYDSFTGQSDSEWKRMIRAYQDDGKTEKQAKSAATKYLLGELVEDTLLGGLAGGLMAGANLAIDDVYNTNAGKQYRSMGEDVTRAIIQEGLDSPKGSLSYDLARKLQTKLDAGKMLTNAEIGRLYRANVFQIGSEGADGTAGSGSESRRPGIRPTWDTDSLLRQAAMEMHQDADPLVQLAQEMYADAPQEAQTAWEGDTQGLPAPLVELAQEMYADGPQAAQTAWEGDTQDLPAPLVELAQETYADAPQEAQTAWEGDTQGLPAPLVQLAQEMAETSIALEQTAMERVQLVQAQAGQTFGLRARAFGWNGQAALLEAWTGQRSTPHSKQSFYDGFALYYQAGLTGEDMGRVYNRHAWALTASQKQAAYRAGQQDAAVFAARGRGGAGRASTPLTVADRVRAALTGQRERATIGTAEAEDTVFSNEIDELQGRRWISYGDSQEFERDTGRITARRVENFSENNLFVQDGVKLSKTGLRRINNLISQAKGLMKIADACDIPIVISHSQRSVAAYNPRTDVIFIDSQFGKKRVSWELQAKYACPDDPLSTLVHEMFHWKDAHEYRQRGYDIRDADSVSAYTSAQRELCRKKLLDFGVDLDDVARMGREVSPYAREELMKNNYEEVLAEYRTYLLLKGGH